MSKHLFVESSEHGSEYAVVIYCQWCGKVVWDFNRTDKSVSELQESTPTGCVYDQESTRHRVVKPSSTVSDEEVA